MLLTVMLGFGTAQLPSGRAAARHGGPRQGHQGPGRRGEARQGQGRHLEGQGQDHDRAATKRDHSEATVQGLDHFRSEFEGEFSGNKVKGVTVLNGDKGWRKFGDMVMELDNDAVANEKRTVYLMVVPTTLVPLKPRASRSRPPARRR